MKTNSFPIFAVLFVTLISIQADEPSITNDGLLLVQIDTTPSIRQVDETSEEISADSELTQPVEWANAASQSASDHPVGSLPDQTHWDSLQFDESATFGHPEDEGTPDKVHEIGSEVPEYVNFQDGDQGKNLIPKLNHCGIYSTIKAPKLKEPVGLTVLGEKKVYEFEKFRFQIENQFSEYIQDFRKHSNYKGIKGYDSVKVHNVEGYEVVGKKIRKGEYAAVAQLVAILVPVGPPGEDNVILLTRDNGRGNFLISELEGKLNKPIDKCTHAVIAVFFYRAKSFRNAVQIGPFRETYAISEVGGGRLIKQIKFNVVYTVKAVPPLNGEKNNSSVVVKFIPSP